MDEHLQNVRRMAERGLKKAQEASDSAYVDIFQHVLDELGRVPEVKGNQKLSPALIRGQHLQWVDEHKFLPEHSKKEMKDIVAHHHSLILQTLGVIELTYRRTLAHDE